MAEIAGLQLIVPTSVAGSGVSVSASGKVTFTSAAAVSVNGCFTSSYDNYLVVYRSTLATGSPVVVGLRLRLSGTDASGSNYVRQLISAQSTTVSASREITQSTTIIGSTASGTMAGEHIYFYGPNLAQPTAIRNVNAGNIASASIMDVASTHSLSTAYDGFTLYPLSSSLSGVLTVYGLSQ